MRYFIRLGHVFKNSLLIILILAGRLSFAQTSAPQNTKDLLHLNYSGEVDTNQINLITKKALYYHLRPVALTDNPAKYRSNQDSAILLYKKALQLSVRLHREDLQLSIVSCIADCEKEFDPKNSKQLLFEVLNYYHGKRIPRKEAQALEHLADTYFNNHQFNDDHFKKLKYYQHARILYLDCHEVVSAARVLTKIAAHRIVLRQYEKAEADLQKSLIEYKTAGYKNLQYLYANLVDLAYAKGDYYRAIAYCLQGIKSFAPGDKKRYLSYFYWNAARSNFGKKYYKDALNWLNKAVSNDSAYPDFHYLEVEILLANNRADDAFTKINYIRKAGYLHTSWDTANFYRCLALYYGKKNKSDLCVKYYLKSLDNIRSFYGEGGYSWKLICYNGIAKAYINAHQATKAILYINKAASIFKEAESKVDPSIFVDYYHNADEYNPTLGEYRAAFKNAITPLYRGLLLSYYENSYKYDSIAGNYLSAFQHSQQHHKLYDSLSTLDKNFRIAQLNIQYQSSQKELLIKNLQNQAAAQQERIKLANVQRNITIGGLIILIAVSGLLYRNYRQKYLANSIITKKNYLLQNLVTEKEWLLKEVHHRVKNNLHTVISLLESQAAFLENDALKAIENSQRRIYAMSLIHQKLYLSEDIKTIDMSLYIPELVQSLQYGFETLSDINFQTNIQSIQLPLSHAIPLGLIINEAITNSIKHAFADKATGEIIISMVAHGNRIQLELSDNGIGMQNPEFNNKMNSLGLRLIQGLSEDMGADLTFLTNNGTKIIISFSLEDEIP